MLLLYAPYVFPVGVLPAPVCRAVHRQTSRHDGGLQQLPGVWLCHQGNHEDQGTLNHCASQDRKRDVYIVRRCFQFSLMQLSCQAMTLNWNWKAFTIQSASPSAKSVICIINVKRCSDTSWNHARWFEYEYWWGGWAGILSINSLMWICLAWNKKINYDKNYSILLLSEVRFVDVLALFPSVCFHQELWWSCSKVLDLSF